MPSIGRTFNMVGYTWRVVHEQHGIKYCILNNILKYVKWNTSCDINPVNYTTSDIKKECDQFTKDTGIDQLDYVVDTGVSKVFIPTKTQMNGESNSFSYMNSNIRRSTDEQYWLSTTSATLSLGSRPCIAIRY